ncbi:MAG: GNAT family N-acetyltransferase [Legionella sp.]|nr:GNAT family N-acetyltransferase [Legionella sp.]
MLRTTHQLSSSDLNALKTLLNTCQEVDSARIPVYSHLLKDGRSGPPSLLYYQQEQLVGFLALFRFHANVAEIALLTHPSYRKQGLASQLWESMCQNVQLLNLPLTHFIVSSPQGLNQTWSHQHAFHFENTEYNMTCPPYAPRISHQCIYTIKTADYHDIDNLYTIDHACFNPNRPEPIQRIKKMLSTPNCKIFILFHKKQIIGQVHLKIKDQKIWLTDFAILPHMQQQGFGKILLIYCMKYAYKHHKKEINLTVLAKNTSAVHLYQNIGFQIYNAIDYYKRRFSLDRF